MRPLSGLTHDMVEALFPKRGEIMLSSSENGAYRGFMLKRSERNKTESILNFRFGAEIVESRLDTLIQNNGKPLLLVPESTPKWIIDQINTSNIAHVIIEPMLAK